MNEKARRSAAGVSSSSPNGGGTSGYSVPLSCSTVIRLEMTRRFARKSYAARAPAWAGGREQVRLTSKVGPSPKTLAGHVATTPNRTLTTKRANSRLVLAIAHTRQPRLQLKRSVQRAQVRLRLCGLQNDVNTSTRESPRERRTTVAPQLRHTLLSLGFFFLHPGDFRMISHALEITTTAARLYLKAVALRERREEDCDERPFTSTAIAVALHEGGARRWLRLIRKNNK